MALGWIFGAVRNSCKTCGQKLKDEWVEAYGEFFCCKECSLRFAETDPNTKEFLRKAKGVQEFRKKHNLNRPGAIPQTRDGEGGDAPKK